MDYSGFCWICFSFCLLQMLTDGLVVDYCDVFIRLSFWRHPSTAETFLQTWWRNKLRRSKFSAHFHLWLNYSFKCCMHKASSNGKPLMSVSLMPWPLNPWSQGLSLETDSRLLTRRLEGVLLWLTFLEDFVKAEKCEHYGSVGRLLWEDLVAS